MCHPCQESEEHTWSEGFKIFVLIKLRGLNETLRSIGARKLNRNKYKGLPAILCLPISNVLSDEDLSEVSSLSSSVFYKSVQGFFSLSSFATSTSIASEHSFIFNFIVFYRLWHLNILSCSVKDIHTHYLNSSTLTSNCVYNKSPKTKFFTFHAFPASTTLNKVNVQLHSSHHVSQK